MVAIALERLRDVCCSTLQEAEDEDERGNKRSFRVCCFKRRMHAISLP